MHSKKNIKIGFIGSGFAATFHYEAVKKVYSVEVEIIGAFSTHPEKLHTFTIPKGIQAFDNLNDLISKCDVLHVCTPPWTHEEITISILVQNKFAIVEKPFTGFFGDGTKNFNGMNFNREVGLKNSLSSVKRLLAAEKNSTGKILYAENWIYAPAIQKEKELIEKTDAQILWIQAQQSHSGSHSMDYGKWNLSGGGSLMGKGSHPIAAALYLKQIEGIHRHGIPIRPKILSAKTHAITKINGFRNEGKFLRDSYEDVEDYANVHIVFEDGCIADIIASELTHGGVKNYLEINANNHRTICNIAPNNAMQTYNPKEENFENIYVVEKTGTKQGWSFLSPDEAWFNGYQQEIEAFYQTVAFNTPIESNSQLASDVINVVYTAYLSAMNNGKFTAMDLNY